MSRGKAYAAAGCAGVSGVLMLLSCGLAVLIRDYRELTVPLSVLLGVLAAALAWIAYRTLSAPSSPERPNRQ